jgi:hypothetical protein
MYNAGKRKRYTLNTRSGAPLTRIEGVDIPPKYGPPREGDVRDSQADNTAAVRDLGHAPHSAWKKAEENVGLVPRARPLKLCRIGIVGGSMTYSDSDHDRSFILTSVTTFSWRVSPVSGR